MNFEHSTSPPDMPSSKHPILECVPNFSEGRDLTKIESIASVIENVEGVKLLHTDIGYDANRTVITFAGTPNAVVEAAFMACKKAAEIIDMRQHKGIHPRFGAIDVLPLIPIRGVTMEEAVAFARNLGSRLGNELGIHVYCYEYAAFTMERRNLASCRAGEYEYLEKKIHDPDWKPDFGPQEFNPKTGATAVGARKLLIAYNINLDTKDIEIASKIAGKIRESGTRNYKSGTSVETTRITVPGKFKGLKAIGWYVPQYGKVQVSTNITDVDTTPIHLIYEEIKNLAKEYGVEVTGSEIIGLIPMHPLLQAGQYYLKTLGKSIFNDSEAIDTAMRFLGLNDVQPFIKEKKVLEYLV